MCRRVGEPAVGDRLRGDVPRPLPEPVALPRAVADPLGVRVGLPMAAVPRHGEQTAQYCRAALYTWYHYAP